MRPAVIGGAGFLGVSIVAALRRRGLPVVVPRRRSTNTLLVRRLGVELRDIDMGVARSIEAALAGCETLYYAAGAYPGLQSEPDLVEGACADLRRALTAAGESS